MEDRRRVLQGDGGANADDGCGNGSELVDIRAGQEANESPCRLSELQAAQYAVSGGHTAVVDLLAGEFGAWIVVGCSIREAMWGHDAMIDRLVERYGVDPIAVDGAGWTALPCLESDRIPVRVTITSSDRHRDGWGVRGSAEAGKHPRCPQRTRHVHSPGDTLT